MTRQARGCESAAGASRSGAGRWPRCRPRNGRRHEATGRPRFGRPDRKAGGGEREAGAPRAGGGGAQMNAVRPPAAPGTPAARGAQDSLIEARDIVLSFGQTPALRGASLSAVAGEILAIMGPSGSGKSTLMHCLAGILTPDSGEVWFEGRRVDRLREQGRSALRRDHFGFVFQFGQLVPELTAAENVALPLLLGGTRRTQALKEAEDLVRAPRPGRPGAAQIRRTVRRAGPARRPGPRSCRAARGPVRRRADRVARLPGRRAGRWN